MTCRVHCVRRRAAALALILVALASGCSAPDGDDAAQDDLVQLRVGLLAPLTGDQAATGRGVLTAVESVLADSAARLEAHGVSVAVAALDDRGQQSGGQQQVTQVVDDASVVALIGSTSSSVDEGVQPILAAGRLAQVSLGGAEPWLTATVDGDRRFASYLTGSAQRSDLARASAAVLGPDVRRVVIVQGARQADAATARLAADEVVARGGRVVAAVRPSGAGIVAVDPAAVSRAEDAVVGASLRAGPTGVLVMGDADLAWRTAAVAKRAAPSAVVVVPSDLVGRGPDGVLPTGPSDPQRILAVAPGAPPYPEPAPTASATATQPTAAEAEQAPIDRRFAASAADAANAVVQALLETPIAVLRGEASATPTPAATGPQAPAARVAVLQRLQRSSHEGRVGSFRFDGLGVATRRPAASFALSAGLWVAVGGLAIAGDCDDRCIIQAAAAA